VVQAALFNVVLYQNGILLGAPFLFEMLFDLFGAARTGVVIGRIGLVGW
jgi:hypothetical protein